MSYSSSTSAAEWNINPDAASEGGNHGDYLVQSRNFWNTDEQTSKYGRVDTISRNEAEYERRADKDFETVFSGVEIAPNGTILEIGCGIGRLLTRVLSNATCDRVIGVDISERMIQHARAALGAKNNLMLLVNTGTDLSTVPNASVDFAYSKDVFIHIHDVTVVRGYFAEVRRVLKSNGIFRFNVRRMDLARMFSNSPGGLLAKCAYLTGAWSPIRQSKGEAVAGFDGIQYRKRDIRRIAKDAGMDVAVVVQNGQMWCTCRLLKTRLADTPASCLTPTALTP